MIAETKKVLTVAGSDSIGGAGIQADIKTFQALGVFGASAITAVTIQNTLGVKNIYPLPAEMVFEQIKAVVEDIGVDAMKTGMLFSGDIVDAVASAVVKFGIKKFVIDPVIRSKSGEILLKKDGIQKMREKLIPICTVITPNIPEAEELTGFDIIKGGEDIVACAKEILKMGAKYVVIKGGHIRNTKDDSTVKDIIATEEGIFELKYPRVAGEFHGTGCTFSAALTAYLAIGFDVIKAVHLARAYIQMVIEKSSHAELGKGSKLLIH